MAYIQGEGRSQGTLFPVVLDNLVPADHMCRVVDAFVGQLNMKQHPEPEVGFMVMGRNTQPAYNLQSAVDAEHALIIAHDVVLDAADNRSLEPMAVAAKAVLGREEFHVVADAGYSNGEQAANCEAKGIHALCSGYTQKKPAW